MTTSYFHKYETKVDATNKMRQPTEKRINFSVLIASVLPFCVLVGSASVIDETGSGGGISGLERRGSSRSLAGGDADTYSHESKEDWYSRYPNYPEYCSTPKQMESRSIPPLRDDDIDRVGETRLVHVTSIIRHGGRTPLQQPGTTHCWDGYWESESGKWDCDLTTLMMPPTPSRVKEEEGTKLMTASTSMFLFSKQYDSLNDPKHNLSNILNGTCQWGQLIMQGYEHSLTNGRFLRDAYLYEAGTYSHDERMRLFDISDKSGFDPWDEHNLYLRSDDDQRTMMSGQLLLRGLFEPEIGKSQFPTIPVHTADRDRDVVGGIAYECPRLESIKRRAETSKEYWEFYYDEESKAVRDFMINHLSSAGGGDEDGIVDCLMTSVCTDRPLPDDLAIYNPHPNSWFERIGNYHAKNHSFHFKYNDGEYSKLSLGPLFSEIFDHILPVVNDDEEKEDRDRPPAKLAIYSGHDSTVMQVLSALGPNVWDGSEWPAYASMILIEVHELIDGSSDRSMYKSNHVFRLIYNGKVLTSLVPGCPKSDFCDAQVLVNHVKPFAIRSIDCFDGSLIDGEAVWQTIKSLLSKTGGLLLVLCIVAISASVGGATMFFYLTGNLPDTGAAIRAHRAASRKKNKKKFSYFGNNGSDREGMGLFDEVEMTFTDAATSSPDDES